VTAEIMEADRLGYDTAWIAEHHFSNQYGILPDPSPIWAICRPRPSRSASAPR
jgi:alkanesulfonate monooxygenase SsuD/methylene tetrahydromethanopterin reductase-like flavin-dependent oxidoreductase (luciferase family)